MPLRVAGLPFEQVYPWISWLSWVPTLIFDELVLVKKRR